MARSAYPTDSDVAAVAGSVALPTGFTFAGCAAAAIDEWERRTGYRPFLGSGTAQTRFYDPPGPNRRSSLGFSMLGGGRMLDLDNGLYGLTSVTIGVSSGVSGTVLVQGTDFWTEPANAGLAAMPYQWIRFRAPVLGMENSVQVVGLFGYGAAIPEDSWQAIAQLGASLGLGSVMEGLRQNPTRWAEEDIRESFDRTLISGLGSSFRASAEKVLAGYRRVSL